MDIVDILAELPPSLAHSLQLQLENCAVSSHLTEDEAREIVDGVVHQLRIEAKLLGDEVARAADHLIGMITNAVVGKIFG
jgi:hypothetical protein